MDTIDITPMIEPVIQREPNMSNLRKESDGTRPDDRFVRSIRDVQRIVVGTSNKTEILLGYTTLWGDMASAINPIGDLYKTNCGAGRRVENSEKRPRKAALRGLVAGPDR